MEGEVCNMNIEELVVPDSYDDRDEFEECYNLNNSISLKKSLLRSSRLSSFPTNNSNYNSHSEEERGCNENENEAGEDKKEEEYPIPSLEGEEKKEEENNEEEANSHKYEFLYKEFLDEHGLHGLDKSSIEELHKTWLKTQLIGSELSWKEAQIDSNFIKFRYAICKQWLSSLS